LKTIITATSQHYSADKPIQQPEQDHFQRAPFAKRIAQTINDRNSDDSLVIGIYGEWGEGKTSLMNLIEGHLQEDVIVCKFNPWRFQDEQQLLGGYFAALATALGRKMESRAEEVAKTIVGYASIFKLGGELAKNFAGVDPVDKVISASEAIAKISLEEQKSKIEALLREEKKKVVIFIDDIDRLDKREIQAVFKLVKLTGDFKYTTYILAFDEKMVANALNEQYGNSNEAGTSFLEKIIQVPLRLPMATKTDLEAYCLNQIEEALSTNNVFLSLNDRNDFNGFFGSIIKPFLTTPRMAIRYANAVSFALPLLHREVNTIDLLLLEGIKVVQPKLYNFIFENRELLALSLSDHYSIVGTTYIDANRDEKEELLESRLKKLFKEYEEPYLKIVKKLLVFLFPIANPEPLINSMPEQELLQRYINKRISSPFYIDRYFTYTVIRGEISDIVFDDFISRIQQGDKATNLTSLNEFLTGTSFNAFIDKVKMQYQVFSESALANLAIVIALYSEHITYVPHSALRINPPLVFCNLSS
jgi:predicted KAP-like P-loop ATPase